MVVEETSMTVNLLRAAFALVLAASVLVLAVSLTRLAAKAQPKYPSQAIKLIVPYAAGGFPDTTARIVGAKLQDKIGQSVVVENRPGGAGSVAVSALSQAAAD